jgi:hypothetical protein
LLPQEKNLYSRFEKVFGRIRAKQIVDDWQIPIPVKVHRKLVHGGKGMGGKGAPWNAAWAGFFEKHGERATEKEVFEHLHKLVREFSKKTLP